MKDNELPDGCIQLEFPKLVHCAYCHNLAEGNHAINRDDYGVGPMVPLCDQCGSGATMWTAAPLIWERISHTMGLAVYRFHREVNTRRGIA